MKSKFDILIAGGGIVGAATAWKLSLRYKGLRLGLLEKESAPAQHQTGHNSGVIHSGVYYKPGSLKAVNCRRGREQLYAFAKEHHIPHEKCGKIILATDEDEEKRLETILARGGENGLDGLQMLDPKGIGEREPEVRGTAALFVPQTGIIDFPAVNHKLIELFRKNGGEVFYDSEVLDISECPGGNIIKTKGEKFESAHLIACAGLQADHLALLDGLNPKMRIVGFRGDYYELTESAKHKVRDLIYPVPDPRFPFLGVHFTRMTDGKVECGPNAVFSFKREGYSTTSFNWKDTLEALGYAGTWKLFSRHWKYGLNEYRRAFSKKRFLEALQKMLPTLEMEDIEAGRSGVRAQAVDREGNLIDDFHIEKSERNIHVLNAPSPAATACLSIADHILEMAGEHFRFN